MWDRKAADQGYPEAQLQVGYEYLNGQGVAADPVLAHMWFSLAAAALPAGAAQDDDLRGRAAAGASLSPAQLGEAQKLVQAWTSQTAQ